MRTHANRRTHPRTQHTYASARTHGGAYDPILPFSNTIICQAGEQLIDGKCTPLGCNVDEKFPIHDKQGNLPKLDNALYNPGYTNPTNVAVGECSQFLTEEYRANKVSSGSSCALVLYFTALGDWMDG